MSRWHVSKYEQIDSIIYDNPPFSNQDVAHLCSYFALTDISEFNKLTRRKKQVIIETFGFGGVAEWLKAAVSKTV